MNGMSRNRELPDVAGATEVPQGAGGAISRNHSKIRMNAVMRDHAHRPKASQNCRSKFRFVIEPGRETACRSDDDPRAGEGGLVRR